MKKELEVILTKVEKAEELTFEEGCRLFKTPDLRLLKRLANKIRQDLHGQKVYFIENLHLNPTNVCINNCPLCAYGVVNPEAKEAFTLSIEQALKIVKSKAKETELKEIHITAGLNPQLSLEYYLELIQEIRAMLPSVFIKALTAVEIAYLAERSRIKIEDILRLLIKAGLNSIPGGGAEIFSENIRKVICPNKLDSKSWLEIHYLAHKLGLKTSCTMLFGHIENIEDRVSHLFKLRAAQKKSQGYITFVLLPFRPYKTKFSYLTPISEEDILRTFSVSRIILSNIPHLKAYWPVLGAELTKKSLDWGSDDIDGPVYMDRIYGSKDINTSEGLSIQRLKEIILEANKTPQPRDGFYNELN
jgi:aminodeoxyfutalosine synthase